MNDAWQKKNAKHSKIRAVPEISHLLDSLISRRRKKGCEVSSSVCDVCAVCIRFEAIERSSKGMSEAVSQLSVLSALLRQEPSISILSVAFESQGLRDTSHL